MIDALTSFLFLIYSAFSRFNPIFLRLENNVIENTNIKGTVIRPIISLPFFKEKSSDENNTSFNNPMLSTVNNAVTI